MFEMLGLNPQNLSQKSQPQTVEAEDSQFAPLGETKMVKTRTYN
jgi:biotin synthase